MKHGYNIIQIFGVRRPNQKTTVGSNTMDTLTLSESREALRESGNRKACGLNELNAELLKYGRLFSELEFLQLINNCWKRCDTQIVLYTAEVISFSFKKNERNCENYRGISLRNLSYKMYSRIINNRLRTINEAVLQEDQAGFKKYSSCIYLTKMLTTFLSSNNSYEISGNP